MNTALALDTLNPVVAASAQPKGDVVSIRSSVTRGGCFSELSASGLTALPAYPQATAGELQETVVTVNESLIFSAAYATKALCWSEELIAEWQPLFGLVEE